LHPLESAALSRRTPNADPMVCPFFCDMQISESAAKEGLIKSEI
jgi:hypothetical protein